MRSLQTIIGLAILLSLVACQKQAEQAATEVITPVVVESNPTPTPLPPPEWPEVLELKILCDDLHRMLRDGGLDYVKSRIPDLAAAAKSIAQMELPEHISNPEMMALFQGQLMKLGTSPRLSGGPDIRTFELPEEVRLYVDSIEYAARNIMLHGKLKTPSSLL